MQSSRLTSHSLRSSLLTHKKLCINCKHFIPDRRECVIFGKTELVSGEIDYDYASSARNDDEKCGTAGKYYIEEDNKLVKSSFYFVKEWWVLSPFLFYILFSLI